MEDAADADVLVSTGTCGRVSFGRVLLLCSFMVLVVLLGE